MSKFTHLHVHSHYSLLDGLSKIDELLDYVKELGMDSVALTDHGVLYGAVEFYKKAKERGIKPIIGCEVYMAYEKMNQRRPNIDDKKYHLVLLIKNEKGYKNLVQLVTKAHLEGFYYKPRIDEELLAKHSEGLICTTGCLQGKIPCLILAKKIEEAEKTALKYQEIFGKDNFYLEIQHHPNLPGQKTVNDALISFSKKLGIPLVATNDCHYLRSEDNEAQDVLMLINTDTKADNPNRKTMKWDDYSVRNPEQMINDFKEVPEAIENTQKIKELCNFEFKLGETKLPYFPLPENKTQDEYLKELCEQGLEKRQAQIKNREEAIKRLEYELSIIKQTKFAPFFLIVQDFVNWAKENRIVVGPGRGCFLPDTKILLKNGYQKNIEEIKPGEKVITHLSHEREVKKVLSYDTQEEIAVIKTKMSAFDLKLTKDHKVLAARHQMCPVKKIKETICKPSCNRSCRKKIWKNYKLEWIKAEELKKKDFLLYPIHKNLSRKKIVFDLANLNLDTRLKNNARYVWYEVGTNKLIQKKIPRFVNLDEKLATFLGFYTAEGWSRTKKRESAIGFGFHQNEKEYIEEVKKLFKEIFDLEASIIKHKSRHSTQVIACSLIVGKFLEKLCGKGAFNKHIPDEIIKNSNKIIISFLVALFKGDGSRKGIMRVSFDSISYNLVSQVKMLLSRLEIMSSIKLRKYKKQNWRTSYKLRISGRQLFKFNQLFQNFQIDIKNQKFYRNDTFIWKNYIWFPVKKVEFEKYKGKVYDLSIKKDTSYVANDISVHNSDAGSLVCYLLNITDINPIKYELIFERFLNPERVSMPDFDIDFSDWRRNEVIDYVAQKYGRDKVAQIITFGTMASRAVIRDVGRALQYPYSYCDHLAKLIPFGFTLKQTLEKIDEFRQIYESDEKATRLIDLAKKLEGVVRHASTHACGVVISKKPLTELVPLQHPTQKDETIVTQYELHSIDDLGLLKIDFLGLKNLTIIEDTLSRIYKVQDKSIRIEDIPLDDKKTYELLQKGESTSVFQLESGGMQRYLKQLKPSEFEDIIAMVSLYRPGPMQFIPSYIKGKHNPKKIKYIHPKLEPILERTYGIMVYQEQLMQITQKIAGFSLSEADVLRKAVGKKNKKLLLEQKEKFIKGAINQSVKKEIAQKIWEWILPFASYGFNRCITEDTQIMDADTGKIITIQKMLKQKKLPKVLSCNKNLKLKKAQIEKIFENGEKLIYEITTRLGKKIKITNNHPFLTIDGWKTLKELRIGRRIGLTRQIPINNKGLPNIKDYQLVVLGYVLSEGNLCHPYGFYVYSTNKEELKDYKRALEKFRNTKATFNNSKSATSIYAGRINLKTPSEAVNWIEKIGLKWKKATEKEFPKFVFKLNKKQLSLLIAKMFQGDGCINIKRKYPQFFYATSSLNLAYQLQHLLLRLGVISSLHQKRFKYRGGIKLGYTINISRYENFKNFYLNMGSYLIGKPQKNLEKIIKNHPIISKKIKPNSARGSKDIIPVEIREIIRNEIKEKGYSSFKKFAKENGFSERLLWIDKIKKGYLRETLQIIGESLNSKTILNYANSDIYWDEIVNIKPVGKEKTYDLTIKDTHNFLANDFIIHNSHGASYAMIAYRTAYLKTNYPIEFMAAALTSEKNDIEKIAFLIEECKRMKIEVLAPDINESFRNFSVVPDEKKIRFGLLAIKNVGHNVVEAIVGERKNNGSFASIDDFITRVSSKNLNKKSLESLIKAGVFDKFEERNKLLQNLERLLEWSRETQKNKANGQKGLFDSLSTDSQGKKINHNGIILSSATLASKKERLNWEKELLGLYITSHPLESFKKAFEKKVLPLVKISQDITGKIVRIGGVICGIKKIIAKNGKPMLFVRLEDQTDKIELVVFPSVIEQNPTIFQENKIVMVRGRVDNRGGVPKIICNEIEEVIEEG